MKQNPLPTGLPEPTPEERAHSERLAERIRDAILEAGGCIGFDRFMERALYAPGLGYYSAGRRKFGAEGDFVTAPEISPLFSKALARQCAGVLHRTGGDILEFGAGSGVMAGHLITELGRQGVPPQRYLILEVSAELRDRQRRTLDKIAPEWANRVEWLDRLPEAMTGVVLANEVLDAMPVQRFRVDTGGAVRELCIGWDGDRPSWRTAEPAPGLAERVERLRKAYALPIGYTSEVNFRAEAWMASLGTFLRRGAAFVIDYGFPRAEFYHPQRAGGTLMCHYRHRSHDDPLILPGLQDITAHVDFTALAEAAHNAGLGVLGFTNQANFLIGNGLLELAADAPDEATRLEAAAQVKRLTLPGEMGELFKVLAIGRGLEGPLAGFAMRDDRARLG